MTKTEKAVDRQHRSGSGFTLVELLVVIAIIALLLSILMPSLNRARQQAKKVLCQANLKQQGTISIFYSNDSSDAMVPNLFYDMQAGNNGYYPVPWPNILSPYITGNNKAKYMYRLHDWNSSVDSSQWLSDDKVQQVFKCPSQKDPFAFNFHTRYGVMEAQCSFYGNSGGITDWRPLQRSKISAAAEKIFIADTMDDQPTYVKMNGQWKLTLVVGRATCWIQSLRFNEYSWDIPISDRHIGSAMGGSNVLWVDGHGSYMPYDSVMPYRGELQSSKNTFNKKRKLWGLNPQ